MKLREKTPCRYSIILRWTIQSGTKMSTSLLSSGSRGNSPQASLSHNSYLSSSRSALRELRNHCLSTIRPWGKNTPSPCFSSISKKYLSLKPAKRKKKAAYQMRVALYLRGLFNNNITMRRASTFWGGEASEITETIEERPARMYLGNSRFLKIDLCAPAEFEAFFRGISPLHYKKIELQSKRELSGSIAQQLWKQSILHLHSSHLKIKRAS